MDNGTYMIEAQQFASWLPISVSTDAWEVRWAYLLHGQKSYLTRQMRAVLKRALRRRKGAR